MIFKCLATGMTKAYEIHGAAERAKAAHEIVNKAGARMQLFYTIGKYDFVALLRSLGTTKLWRLNFA